MKLSLNIAFQLGCFTAKQVIRSICYMSEFSGWCIMIKLHNLKNFFQKNNSFNVYNFDIQSLAIEMFKVSNNIAPTIIDDLFKSSHHSYNLWSISNFAVAGVHTVHVSNVKIIHIQWPYYLRYDTGLHKRIWQCPSISHVVSSKNLGFSIQIWFNMFACDVVWFIIWYIS